MTVGMSDTTAQLDAKEALLAAARVALEGEDVDVSFGFRWPLRSDDWFSVVDTQSEVDPKVIGPRMTQDETLTLSVSVGSWRSGDDEETELATAQRAFGLLSKVQHHIRNQDPTLNGTVLWCLLGPSSSAGATTEDDAPQGRVTEVAAQFICKHRIRN